MKFHNVDQTIVSIRQRLDYQRYMTPDNYEEENRRFLQHYADGRVYNPQYRYQRFVADEAIGRDIERCMAAVRCETGVGRILYRAAKHLQKEVQMYSLIGDDDAFSACGNEIFGIPDERLYETAKATLKQQEGCETQTPCYDAEHVQRVFERRLKAYGFDWAVVRSAHMASRVSVEPEQKTVYINETKWFSAADVKRLLVHEIDTHVLRCENGERRGYAVFSSGTAGSLIHEEGLAIYNEWKHHVQDAFSSRLYAARFLTCCRIDRPFFELFDELVRLGCDKDQAMYVVARIKRGLSDTSKPGGFIKDYVYFQGFHEIREHLQQHPQAYAPLYYGSISLTDTEILKDDIEQALCQGTVLLPIESDAD